MPAPVINRGSFWCGICLLIVGRQHQPRRAIFAIFGDFTFLKDAEGFARIVRAHHLFRVEDIAEFIARQAVSQRKPCIEISADLGAAVFIPVEGRAIMAEVARKGCHRFAGISEFKHARENEGEVYGGVSRRRKDRELLHDEKGQMQSANF